LEIKFIFLFILVFYANFSFCSIKVCSWNLKDFGKSKSNAEIVFIANVVKEYDVVAIQEVVAGAGGAQAVARLVTELNTKGTKWDYVISDPTSGSSYKTERYAYVWKASKLQKQKPAWFEWKYSAEIDREPYFLTLISKGKSVTFVNFHAITKSKQPEREVKFFKFLPAEYPEETLFFVGDFNLPESHSVFNPLKKMGYTPLLLGQKTSLRLHCVDGDCLASEFDNMFINLQKLRVLKSGIIRFYEKLPDFKQARLISDHVPIFAEIEIL
jgi:deoxyribonuclease-1-like protein